jgi:putative oxidoreductase
MLAASPLRRLGDLAFETRSSLPAFSPHAYNSLAGILLTQVSLRWRFEHFTSTHCLGAPTMDRSGSFASAWASRLLSVLRIVTAGLFMQHGMAKLFHVPHVASFDNVQLMSLIGLAGVLELVGGALLVLGLFTRPVAFVLSGEMAFAYFMAHAPKSPLPLLNGGELAVVYCFVFLYFAAAGGGAWSVDAARRRA